MIRILGSFRTNIHFPNGPQIPIMVLPGTFWSFQVLNRFLYLWQLKHQKRCSEVLFFLECWPPFVPNPPQVQSWQFRDQEALAYYFMNFKMFTRSVVIHIVPLMTLISADSPPTLDRLPVNLWPDRPSLCCPFPLCANDIYDDCT